MMLLNATITSAGTFTGSIFQFRGTPGQQPLPGSLIAQKTFTYGSGGTTVDTYLQTSLDGGTTWADVVHYAQNLLASDPRPLVANVSSATTTPTAPVATTDGTLAVNSTSVGIFGPLWRVKYVVAGTYAGGTTLRVDAFGNGLVPSS